MEGIESVGSVWGLVHEPTASPVGERATARLQAELLTGTQTPTVAEILLKAKRLSCNCDEVHTLHFSWFGNKAVFISLS